MIAPSRIFFAEICKFAVESGEMKSEIQFFSFLTCF